MNGRRPGTAFGMALGGLRLAAVAFAVVGGGVATAGKTSGGASDALTYFPLAALRDNVEHC